MLSGGVGNVDRRCLPLHIQKHCILIEQNCSSIELLAYHPDLVLAAESLHSVHPAIGMEAQYSATRMDEKMITSRKVAFANTSD